MRTLLFLLCLMTFSTSAAASSLIIEANDDGQVIVDAEQSTDGNEYILNAAEPEAAYGVQMMSATTFSTNHYANGFFDNPTVGYTANVDISKLIDNSIFSFMYGDIEIVFEDHVKVSSFYIEGNGGYVIQFLNADDTVVYDSTNQFNQSGNYDYYISIEPIYIKKIKFLRQGISSLEEFEVFLQRTIDYIAVDNIKVATDVNNAQLTFDNPDSVDFVRNEIFLDDEVFASNTTDTVFNFEDLKEYVEYTVTVRSHYIDGKYIDAVKKFRTKKDTKPPANVTDLTLTAAGSSVILSWTNPTDEDFSHVRIYRNSVSLANDITDTTYTDDTIKTNVNYSYRVVTIDKKGNQSNGVTGTIMVAGTNVYNVRAQAKSYDKVDISWKNPAREDFEIVTIYRKKKETGIMPAVFSLFTNDDNSDYTQLFQTNGTIFNDMTVAADTAYTYKLTATLADDTVSDGVTVDVKTPKSVVAGGGSELDADTNEYVITWTSPVVGQIKVLIANVEYAIVPAANKEIRIPAASMVLDFLGRPDVKLVPIDDSGKEGTPSTPGGNGGGMGTIIGGSGADAVLNAPNLLGGGVALLKLVGLFVILGLAFYLVNKLISLIVSAFVFGSIGAAITHLKNKKTMKANERFVRNGGVSARGRWNDED